MSFAPLPAEFLDVLDGCGRSGARALDLGCGEETFWATRAPARLYVVRLDRRPPWLGTVADVVADAGRAPFASGSFDLVVASNLFRHILDDDSADRLLTGWQGLVSPGGRLFLFEDEPGSRTPAERNYAELQRFLRGLLPATRGPLLPFERFREIAARVDAHPDAWIGGRIRNELLPDRERVLGMLVGDGRPPQGQVRRLIERIRAEGLSYGSYWWAAWRRPGAEE